MNTWAEREAHRISQAIKLLKPGIPGPGGVWADVGCGDGIFTSALHTLIRPTGEIYAVDRDPAALDALVHHLTESYKDIVVHPVRADFTRKLTLSSVDGIVMANSLHFVKEKAAALDRLVRLLRHGGRLIVVEYNTIRGNSAVPYPLCDQGFLDLAAQVCLHEAHIASRVPSRFLGEMYAGVALA